MTIRGTNEKGNSVPCAFIIATCFAKEKPDGDDLLALEDLAFYPVLNEALLQPLKHPQGKLDKHALVLTHKTLLLRLQQHNKNAQQLALFNDYCALMLEVYNSFFAKVRSLSGTATKAENTIDPVIGYLDGELRRLGLTSAIHDTLGHAHQVVTDDEFVQIMDGIKLLALVQDDGEEEDEDEFNALALFKCMSDSNPDSKLDGKLGIDKIQHALQRAAKSHDKPGDVSDLPVLISQITSASNNYFHQRYLTNQQRENLYASLISDYELTELELQQTPKIPEALLTDTDEDD